jgi:ABC-type nitrate/sulfonate/bicarbonate transport system substrate-binding protein
MLNISRREFAVGAAALAASSGRVAAQAPVEVMFGLPSTSLGAAFPRLTFEMGFFAKHGLQMRMPVLESAAVATAALVSGSVKGIQAGPSELVAAQANGQKVVAIQIAYAGFAQTLVLSKAAVAKIKVSPNAPVVERMKALEGLLLASASATSGATVAIKVAALKMAGVNVRWTYIAQTTMQTALEQGAIDGYIASAPFSTLAIAKGLAVSWASGPNGDLPVEYTPANAGIIMVMRDFAEANPDIIKRMMAAFADFCTVVEQRPDEVKATVARLFPDLDKPSLDLFFSTESRAWRVKGPPTVAQMEHEIRFTKDSGVNLPNPQNLNAAAMVYP